MVLENSISSISEGLLKKSINYARTFVDISSGGKETIMHCRKSLLFHNLDIWITKVGNKDFGITMGSLDGIEICELVGLYFIYIYILSTKYGRNHNGIYRDDGLACFKNFSGPKVDWIRRDLITMFRKKS